MDTNLEEQGYQGAAVLDRMTDVLVHRGPDDREPGDELRAAAEDRRPPVVVDPVLASQVLDNLLAIIMESVPASRGFVFLLQRETPLPAPPPGAPGGVTGLDHVVIRTPDPERAAALYGARFGLDMRLDRSNEAWGARLMFFRCGDLIVELAHDLRAGVSAGPDRLWGLSWRTDDPAAAIIRLRSAGLDVSEARPGRKPGTQVFTVRDGTCGVPTLMLQPSGPPAPP